MTPLMLNTRPYINIYASPSAIYIPAFARILDLLYSGTFFLSVLKGRDITVYICRAN